MSTPGGLPGMSGAGDPNDPNVKMAQDVKRMQYLMSESCYGKTVLSGVMGFGLGGMFGLFMASMAYDTPMHTATTTTMTTTTAAAAAAAAAPPPWRAQLRHGVRDMGARALRTARSFGAVGALFSGVECGIEGLRARHDAANGVAAGCVTGAVLARAGGPQAVAAGCAGFAAFSAAVDAWMRMPREED